jgi:hypothetical protein
MSDTTKIPRHIQAKQMRASGMSFQQIADQLAIKKSTAVAHYFYHKDICKANRRKNGKMMTLHIPAELMELAYQNIGGQKPFIQRLINILATEPVLVKNLCDESNDDESN